MSFVLGIFGSLTILLTACLGSQVKGNSELFWLILILALAFPFRAVIAVPSAIVASSLNFKPLRWLDSLVSSSLLDYRLLFR